MIQLTGGFSLMSGITYGRVLGIVGGALGAIWARRSIGGNNSEEPRTRHDRFP